MLLELDVGIKGVAEVDETTEVFANALAFSV